MYTLAQLLFFVIPFSIIMGSLEFNRRRNQRSLARQLHLLRLGVRIGVRRNRYLWLAVALFVIASVLLFFLRDWLCAQMDPSEPVDPMGFLVALVDIVLALFGAGVSLALVAALVHTIETVSLALKPWRKPGRAFKRELYT